MKFFRLLFLLCISFQVYSTLDLTQPATQLSDQEIEKQLEQVFAIFPDPTTTCTNFTEFDSIVSLIFEKSLGMASNHIPFVQRFYAQLKQEAVKNYLEITSPPAGYTQKSITDAMTYVQEQIQLATYHNDPELKTWSKKLSDLQAAADQAVKQQVIPNSIELCRQTNTWQNHLKVLIANSFLYELQLLGDINQDEIKMFSFLPQFETAYYTEPYKNLRNSSEYVRMFLVLTDLIRQRALAQCDDWKAITDPSILYEKVENFKEGDFYQFCKSFDELTNSKVLIPLKNQFLIGTSDKNYSIALGYRNYLTYTVNDKGELSLEACPGMTGLFSIQGQDVFLTPLGNFVLEESTITPLKGNSYQGLVRNENFSKLFTETSEGYTPTDTFIELFAFNAIRMLSSLNGYLFNSANLSDTMERLYVMRTQNPSINFSVFPSIIPYEPEDQLFLEEINLLSPLLTASSTPSQTTSPTGFFSSLWDDIESAFETMAHTLKTGFEKVGSDIWHAVQAAGGIFVHLAYAVEDQALGVYYETGIACLVTGESYAESQDQAASYFNSVGAQIGDATTCAEGVVNDVCDAAQQCVNMAGSIIGQVSALVTQDPRFGADVTGCFESIGALAIDAFRDGTDFLVGVAGDLVKLTVEAINVIAISAADVVTGNVNAAGALGNYFVQDFVTSILGCASLLVTMISDALQNLMMALAYFTSMIVDLVIDIAGVIGGLAAVMTGGNFESGRESWMTTVAAHRRLMTSIVTAVIMIAITIGTAGTGSAFAIFFAVIMTVMTTAMMAITCVGANQQDLSAISKKQTQEEFLALFKIYVETNPPAQYSIQGAMFNETKMRLLEEEINADRGLVYYQNYLNSSINTLRSTQAYQLGSFYDQLITPDTTNYPSLGLMPADTGYNYGIETNRLDLNPCQGFRVYNSQRNSFAQEIATKPCPLEASGESVNTVDAMINQQNSSLNQTQSAHFIAQKDLCNLTKSTSTLQIRWRVIYESDGDFYIGIYYNQNHLDTNFLHALNTNFETVAQNRNNYTQQNFEAAWNPLNTFNRYLYNYDQNAKAFICYQNNSTQNKPALGVYEHGPAQFIVSNQRPQNRTQSPWFKAGTWYIMSMEIAGNQIQTTFYEEGINQHYYWSEQVTTTPFSSAMMIPYEKLMQEIKYTSTQSYTGSYGVITSGAAVEYQILSPQQSVVVSEQRKTSNATVAQNYTNSGTLMTEFKREKQWTTQLTQALTPSFAGWKLTPYSDLDIAQGTYVYRTMATGIIAPKTLAYAGFSDYVVSLSNPPGALGTIANLGQPLMGSGATLGNALTNTTQYLVSLVTGKCYNSSGTFVLTYPDALTAYSQQNSSLRKELITSITTAQQAYYYSEEGSFAFQNIVIEGLNSVTEGLHIYSCKSFTPNLSGLDYLIFVNISQPGSVPGADQSIYPLSSQNNITNAVSLVSGIVFSLNSKNGSISQLPSISMQTPRGWPGITATQTTNAWPNTFTNTYKNALAQSKSGKTLSEKIQKQVTSYQAAIEAAQQAQIAAEEAQVKAAEAKAAAAAEKQRQAFYNLSHPQPANSNILNIQNNGLAQGSSSNPKTSTQQANLINNGPPISSPLPSG